MTTTLARPPRRHGTNACYGSGCRRRECRDARAAYERVRVAARRRGEPVDMVDANPVRIHVRTLMAQGMGWQRIATTAGVSNRSLQRLLGYGSKQPAQRMTTPNAERLLSVTFTPLDWTLVDATRTWNLIHGLMAAGYPRSWIAVQLGQIGPRLQIQRRQVRHSTAQAVEQLAEKHAHIPGPSTRARREAARNGWTVAALWEALDGTVPVEETDPVDWVAVELVVAGKRPDHRLDSATRAAAIDLLAAQGMSTTQIGLRLRTSSSDISRHLARRAQPQEITP